MLSELHCSSSCQNSTTHIQLQQMKVINKEKVDMSTSWFGTQKRQRTTLDSRFTACMYCTFVDSCCCAKAICMISLKVTFSKIYIRFAQSFNNTVNQLLYQYLQPKISRVWAKTFKKALQKPLTVILQNCVAHPYCTRFSCHQSMHNKRYTHTAQIKMLIFS